MNKNKIRRKRKSKRNARIACLMVEKINFQKMKNRIAKVMTTTNIPRNPPAFKM